MDDKVDIVGKHQCFNWMTVDPITGIVYVVFYDRRAHDDLNTDVYMAYSTDGGETFINEKISQEPFEPDPDVYLGNYINIAAYGGFVRPIWTAKDEDYLSILMAVIDLN